MGKIPIWGEFRQFYTPTRITHGLKSNNRIDPCTPLRAPFLAGFPDRGTSLILAQRPVTHSVNWDSIFYITRMLHAPLEYIALRT